jgi:hypothetical protein
MFTHWIPPFTQRRRDGTQLAFCETWVFEHEHSCEPTCPACRRMLTEDDAELDALRKEVWDRDGHSV